MVGEDTGEQEEERSLVGRVAEEESKQEGEEQEGGAVEKRTSWQIHSILVESIYFLSLDKLFENYSAIMNGL